MTPLMLSLMFWRAAHPSGAPYPDCIAASETAAVTGALVKLHQMGVVKICTTTDWHYFLTTRGVAFIRVVTTLELP